MRLRPPCCTVARPRQPRRSPRRPRQPRRSLRRVLLVATAAGSVALLAGTPGTAGATGAVPAGPAVITRPDGSQLLRSGGSQTIYGVALPSGAACPADTAHHGILVDSFLVPAGVSPTEENFRGGVPHRWYGYVTEGAYFGAVNTAIDTGEINPLPPEFTWQRLTPAMLFSHGATEAGWEGGIACVDPAGRVVAYWGTKLTFTADASDPGGFRWTATESPLPAGTTGNGSGGGSALRWLAGVGIAVAVVLGGTSLALSLRGRSGGAR